VEFRHLKYFIAVAEELHFGRAARKLHIEQSPLSRAIQDLESQLGVVLLERSTRHVHLTPAGAAFFKEAKRVVAGMRHARLVANSAAKGYQGVLRVGLSNSVIEARLIAAIAKYKERYPEIEILMFELSYAEQLIALCGGQIDAGLAVVPRNAKGVIRETLWHDPLVALLPRHHPLSKHTAIPARELHNHPLIICRRDAEPGLYEQMAMLLQTINLDAIAKHVANSLQGLLTLVTAQCGIGFAGAQQTDGVAAEGIEVRAVVGRPAQLTTCVLRTRQVMSNPLRDFFNFLQQEK
jgi:DNA-binding transcriptional LysR family regulator